MKLQNLLLGFIMVGAAMVPSFAMAATTQIDAVDNAYIQRDGNGAGTGTNWSTQYVNADGSGGGWSITDETDPFGGTAAGSYPAEYTIGRGFVKFPAESDIPDGATINSVDLCVWLDSKFSNASFTDTFNVFEANPSSDSFTTAEFDNVGSTALSDTALDVSAMTTGSYYCFTLNTDGMTYADLSAAHWFSFRTSPDFTNTAPAHDSTQLSVSFDGFAGTNPPYLEVDYTAEEGGGSSSSSSSSPPTFTGSILLFHSVCNDYILGGSGDTVGCSQWDTSMEASFVTSMRTELGAIAYSAIVLLLRWSLILTLCYLLFRWLFRTITHYRPLHNVFRRRR